MKNLIISLAILMFTVSAAHAQTIYFTATDTVHNITMSLDSVYVRCNTNGADTTLYNNPTKYEIGGVLGVDDNNSENAYGIKLSAMNFVNGRLYVMVISPKAGNISFLISDLTGRTLINHSENCIPGANNFALDVAGISAGMYFLTISNGFSVKTYKILGTNSGSGDISITNIGFPITNVLAGTSDFTIIGYATGKIVTVLTDTVDNYTPLGNGNDTIKFDFGDEWSKWKFKSASLKIANMHVIGTNDSKAWSSTGSQGETHDTVDKLIDYTYDQTNEWQTIACHNGPFSNLDTIRFCNSSQTNSGSHTKIFKVLIKLDSINNNIDSFEFYTYSKDNGEHTITISTLLTYSKKLHYEINNEGVMKIIGLFKKEALEYKYFYEDDYSFSMSTTVQVNENDKYAQDEDVQFTLTLEP